MLFTFRYLTNFCICQYSDGKSELASLRRSGVSSSSSDSEELSSNESSWSTAEARALYLQIKISNVSEYFLGETDHLVNQSEDNYLDTRKYMSLIFLLSPFFFFYNTAAVRWRALKDAYFVSFFLLTGDWHFFPSFSSLQQITDKNHE